MNKFVGIALLVSIGICFFAGMIEGFGGTGADGVYLLGGIGIVVFGVWGGIDLIRK